MRAQLEALRSNGAGDRGIAVCFRFASPSNRLSTGPVERFAQMVKAGPYALMLRYRTAEYGPVEMHGQLARVRVTLTGTAEAVTYLFVLSKQTEPGCDGCWMTDAVLIEGVRRRVT